VPVVNNAISRMAGVVLCGGKSSRMGTSKAWLPFGNETMLQRVTRLLSGIFDTVVAVAAKDQELPELRATVLVARDERSDLGPLEGIRAGLDALPRDTIAAYVTGCDVPLLADAFVRQICLALAAFDVAVPVDGEFHHPLAAAYRTSALPKIRSLLAADQRRPFFLFERVHTHRIPVDDLRGVDPELDSLANLNSPQDYARALVKAGLPIASDAARLLGIST
jgi:molybdenum cofactor guanylyltransferase